MPPKSSSQPPPNRNSLPFEPKKNRKASEKKADSQLPPSLVKTKADQSSQSAKSSSTSLEMTAIPEVVSRRMIRRMALLCGVPTAFGLTTFFVSYFLVTQQGMELPNAAVVLVSMGFFGLGVLGLSYGVLSASWDESLPGSAVGWSEFTLNFGRMREAWRSAGKKS